MRLGDVDKLLYRKRKVMFLDWAKMMSAGGSLCLWKKLIRLPPSTRFTPLGVATAGSASTGPGLHLVCGASCTVFRLMRGCTVSQTIFAAEASERRPTMKFRNPETGERMKRRTVCFIRNH